MLWAKFPNALRKTAMVDENGSIITAAFNSIITFIAFE